MTKKLKVHAYNVLFGDAILLEVPDGSKSKFVLIDFGNASTGKGGEDEPLIDTARDISRKTGGKIDLYIMTHEHMDHVQGLLHASEKGIEFKIGTIWMTASSAKDYYDRPEHENARKKKLDLENALKSSLALLKASGRTQELAAILEINSRNTQKCVDFIRNASSDVQYVSRGFNTRGKHPFTEASFRILAPEEDTSVYYRSDSRFYLQSGGPGDSASAVHPLPLQGIDGGAFYTLMDHMEGAGYESVFTIDQAANNTSIVFELTWHGRRLLFTGDAEKRSWDKISENTTLEPVDLIKVGHHGSSNAEPPQSILDEILPLQRKEQAVALLCTCRDVYNKVPDLQVEDRMKARVNILYSTTDVPVGEPVTIEIE